MKVMAIDYGDARTGVAISEASGFLAGETLVIKEWNAQALAQKLVDKAKECGAERIVLGLPKNMDGTDGPRAEKSRELAAMLQALDAPPITMIDERRTTVDAHRILSEAGRRGKKRKETVDAVAATLILETYLNSLPR